MAQLRHIAPKPGGAISSSFAAPAMENLADRLLGGPEFSLALGDPPFPVSIDTRPDPMGGGIGGDDDMFRVDASDLVDPGKVTDQMGEDGEHMLSPRTKQPTDFRRFDCARCGKCFKTTRDRAQHVLTVHEKLRPHKCTICHAEFGLKGNLTKHIKSIHEASSATRLHCPQCTKSFSIKGNLVKHIQTVHEQRNRFDCEICERRYTRRSSLRQHMDRSHSAAVRESARVDEADFMRLRDSGAM
eukprot:CAMPEP_0198317104 /NCGR_PEP_ID=MMETSP1450-20131203/6713_1 /TAXON_ID=753684 ORGANISM="Madagascaria erythrocladiodes, Strain CCMP3234" /NCGR_SAMPLE_ID=MMETSP1450 /ASSEMBLY_ACC=CAM_ASM_001115 /LENGTH=242 /DNA_ID=CAMNT_0044020287 /DNA_START=30 /DNA_END=758 /DNA_ORIENTATION=+